MNQSMLKNLLAGAVVLASLSLFPGCVGGTMTFHADHLEHPASLTQGLFDGQWRVLDTKDYTLVHSFAFKRSRWATFFTLIPLGPNADISDELNAVVKKNGGDGIVNLKFQAKKNPFQICSNILIVSGAIIPGTVTVEVSGDVIKLNAPPAAP
jgi:hypothetical protein